MGVVRIAVQLPDGLDRRVDVGGPAPPAEAGDVGHVGQDLVGRGALHLQVQGAVRVGRLQRPQLLSKVSGDDRGKRFAESLAQAEKALEEWRGAAGGKVETAQAHVKEAGAQAKEGGKNAGASVLWLGAAGAVIYAGLLKDEQRQWVKNKAKAVASGTVELVKDMRGHDGEFTA